MPDFGEMAGNSATGRLSRACAAVAVRLTAQITRLLAAERPQFILWTPVLLGIGIALYFALPVEPAPAVGLAGLACCMWLCWRGRGPERIAGFVALFIILGFCAAQWRTAWQAAPIIHKTTGPVSITGTILKIEERSSDLRLLLAPSAIGRNGAQAVRALPVRIRVTVKRAATDDPARATGVLPFAAGDHIRLRAVLMPPPAPVRPGGFDYGRMLWFDRIGGIGYAVSHPETIAPPDSESRDFTMQPGIWLADLRLRIARHVRARIDGEAGAVAAALMTGDRAAIPEAVTAALRDSGLAHLLAISGLHMGLLAGTIFFALRGGLSLIPRIALYFPIKKWAAVTALAGAFGYLLISGGSVPTQRAFLMSAIVLVAVLCDRTALSMRTVAFAAFLILLLTPEALLQVGFQMSFAAVIALIAVYETLGARLRPHASQGPIRRFVGFFLAIGLTSLVAGLATAPFAIFHFHRFADYGLIANLLAMPLVSCWIMPSAVLAFVLMPFGLDGPILDLMGWGISILLQCAQMVAAWPGAVTTVPDLPQLALITVIAGGLWLCLWRGGWRWAGLAALPVALLIALNSGTRADLMIDADGRELAVRQPGGELVLIAGRQNAYGPTRWAAAEGQTYLMRAEKAAQCDRLACITQMRGGHTVAYIKDSHALVDDCRLADIIISQTPVRHCPSAAVIVDYFDLWRSGGHALYIGKDGAIAQRTVAAERGERPWSNSPSSRYRK